MRTDQGNILERVMLGESSDTKSALIVDSPWIPPFLGISTVW